jgi:hypothetical protein
MDLSDPDPGVLPGGHRLELDPWMTAKQAGQFSTGIPGTTDYCCTYHDVSPRTFYEELANYENCLLSMMTEMGQSESPLSLPEL